MRLSHRRPHSFPTRRSSDLEGVGEADFETCFEIGGGISERPSGGMKFEWETFQNVLGFFPRFRALRSEEHTSELHSQLHLVCRLPLEKKNIRTPRTAIGTRI